MDTIKTTFTSLKNNVIDMDLLSSRLAKVMAIILGFIIAGVILALSGYNPIFAYSMLIEGAFISTKSMGDILFKATPYIFVGLSAAYGFKAGVVNIGISGQMFFGGLLAVIVGVHVDAPHIILLILVTVAGIIGGALWAFIPAIMKLKLGTSEIFTTIMMNYIALQVVIYSAKKIVPGEYETRSAIINPDASFHSDTMSSLLGNSQVNAAFFLAIICAILFFIYFEKTKSGYEMKVVGQNSNAAKYAGINVNYNSFMSLIISGAIAGIAGAIFYCGYTNYLNLESLPAYGWDGITIALIGSNSGFGIVLASILFGFLKVGGEYMSVIGEVPSEIVDIIMAVIIYFAAATIFLQNNLSKIINKFRGGKL